MLAILPVICPHNSHLNLNVSQFKFPKFPGLYIEPGFTRGKSGIGGNSGVFIFINWIAE